MTSRQLKTPVAFIIFKRPDTTEKVFEAIRQAKPSKLFIVADGPRFEHLGEAEKCEKTRAIINRVDWECQVFKNYSDVNLGCAKRVSSGLDWVFSKTEEAIILEDDCVPDSTFFPFCEELLDKYRYDTRIASISGQNVQFGRKTNNYSYYFSRYNHCWGWATWRRAWQHFDFDMKLWAEVKQGDYLHDILGTYEAVERWKKLLQATYEGNINSWAYRWMFACWLQSGLGIISNSNLVSNIGFGTESTNTGNKTSKLANLPTEELEFPLKHPPFITRSSKADEFTQKTVYNVSLYKNIKAKIKSNLLIINKFKKIKTKVMIHTN